MAYTFQNTRPNIPQPDYSGIADPFASGLQQGLPQIQQGLQGLAELQKQKQWQDTINQLMTSPNANPAFRQMAPLIAQRPELAEHILPKMMSAQASGGNVATVYRNPETGELSDQPMPGWTPFQTTQDRALMRLSGQTSQDKRSKALEGLVGVRREGIQARQRDVLAKTTNLPLQQLKTLTQNNVRADRALEVLGQPQVTWQRLGFALTDLAAMMQGGVPHVDQIKDSMFPNWKKQVAYWNTFVSGNPTANVPEPIRQEVMKMVQEVKSVDNEYLKQSQQTQMDILGPTIDGFDQVKPIINRGTDKFIKGGTSQKRGMNDDPLGIRQ